MSKDLRIAVIGRGLIGGSLEKAARRAGYDVAIFPGRGDHTSLAGYGLIFIAVPPASVVPIVNEIAPFLSDGATVVDIAGVKTPICRDLHQLIFEKRWNFVGGHPMAGKEKTGYAQATETLFDGASMILTPFPSYGRDVLDRLEVVLRDMGFARIVYTNPQHHDEMIAFTSQLCHLISSAYVRDQHVREHVGYSAGSFRDMVRVGAPDPDIWTDLFFSNRDALLPVLTDYIKRLESFQKALETGDREQMHRDLEEGVRAKKTLDERI